MHTTDSKMRDPEWRAQLASAGAPGPDESVRWRDDEDPRPPAAGGSGQ